MTYGYSQIYGNGNFDEWAWYVYALLVVAVLVTLIVGLSMIKEKEK